MFCTKCGAKIADGSKFCPYCGFNEQQAAPTPAPPAANSRPAQTPAPAQKSSKKTKEPPVTIIPAEPSKESDDSKWWVWGIVFVVCATLLAVIFLYGSNYIDYSDLDSLNTSNDSGGVTTDEGLLTVTITLPASLFEDEDMSTFDPDAYAQEQGFLSAKVNDDGSVTVKMTKAKHQELLDELAASIEEIIDGLIDGTDTPYIKDITHNDDFSRFDVTVVRSGYENTMDLTPFMLGISAMMYQNFLEQDSYSEIVIVDVDTGDIINTVVYPPE